MSLLPPGTRKGKILLVKWSQVDLAGRAIHVIEAKTEQSRRFIPINDTLHTLFSELKRKVIEKSLQQHARRTRYLMLRWRPLCGWKDEVSARGKQSIVAANQPLIGPRGRKST
jgi:integrase